MIATSSAWKEYIKDSSVFHVKATMTGGSTLQLTDSDFMMGSVSFTDSMSGMNEIALGAVVTNTFNATLNNNDGKFDNWDWTEIEVWFGIEVNGSEEWIKRGKYTIDRPSSIGNTIKIECYDYMDKLNTYYSLVTDITYPLEASRVVYYMCQYCGVDYDFAGTTGWQFSSSFNVNTVFADLNDEATTCRQVLSWILQTMGGYARINPSTGYLECKAWNRSQWSPADEITGGIFDVWNAVATTEGGSVNPWSVVADSNGGTYFDGDGAYALEKIKRQTIMIDDITVTGIRAFTYNTVDEFDFATAGSGGYILAIQDNPLVGSGVGSDKQTIADRVWANVQGLSVRPFNASMFGDPSIEAGDTIILRDAKDNYYVSIITNLTFSLGNDMRVSCDAETAESNQLQTANPTTSAIKGAVTAAYDYLLAKKISADYISAGTLSADVKVDIHTADTEYDVLQLNYANSGGTKISQMLIESSLLQLLYELGGIESKFKVQWGNSAYLFLEMSNDSNTDKCYMDTAGYADFSHLKINGTPVADFVVDEGVDGIWNYRKWDSGIAECWTIYDTTLTSYATPWQGASAYYTSITFPSGLFVDAPNVNTDFKCGNMLSISCGGLHTITATGTNLYGIVIGASGSQSCTWNIQVVGKWK